MSKQQRSNHRHATATAIIIVVLLVLGVLSTTTTPQAQQPTFTNTPTIQVSNTQPSTPTQPLPANLPTTKGLLPGQQMWKNGVSSYLFGTNDTQSWDIKDNIDTDPNHIIQPALKNAHFTLLRSFFFAHSLYDGHATTDSELDQRMQTIQNTGMQCLGVLQDIKTGSGIQFAKHVVSYLGNKCLMYEIGNESDLGGMSIEQYLQTWNSLVPQLRQLNPNAKFGGPVTYNDQGNNCWYSGHGSPPVLGAQNGDCYMQLFLRGVKASGVIPDFITFHWYPCWHDSKTSCLAKTKTFADVTKEVRNWINADLGKNLPLGITEWNMDPGSNTALGNDRQFMSQFVTDALIAMIQAKLDFANEFDTQNYGGYGTLDMFDINNHDQPKAQFDAMKAIINQYWQ